MTPRSPVEAPHVVRIAAPEQPRLAEQRNREREICLAALALLHVVQIQKERREPGGGHPPPQRVRVNVAAEEVGRTVFQEEGPWRGGRNE